MQTYLLERSQRVEVPPERAFAVFGDALNLEPMSPPWLHFEVTTPGEISMGAGTLLDYRLRLHGVPIRWRTLIETWEPPHRFLDRQLKGPYSLWEHSHEFEPDGEGGCVMTDRVRYAIPFGPLGKLAEKALVRRDLERIFDYRRGAFADLVAAGLGQPS
ncbi:MAG: SRPBCC family protein [Solirubrobacterales bacterium]